MNKRSRISVRRAIVMIALGWPFHTMADPGVGRQFGEPGTIGAGYCF